MTSEQILTQMRTAFRAEAFELLNELDSALLELESRPDRMETVHRVFRAIHTLKGSGATAGLTRLAEFAHKVEEVFDKARSGLVTVTPQLIDVSLRACDVLKNLLEDGSATTDEATVLAELGASCGSGPAAADAEEAPSEALCSGAFEISFRPHADLFRNGTDPGPLLDDLAALGSALVTCHMDRVPPLDEVEAESCYLWWSVRLVTDQPASVVREVFSFVEDDCDLDVRKSQDQESTALLLASLPPQTLPVYLMECFERLEEMEAALARADDPVDELFRCVHTIKGNTAVLLGEFQRDLGARNPLVLLHRASHALETRLGACRDGVEVPEKARILACVDLFRGLLESLEGGCEALPLDAEVLAWLGVETELIQGGAAAKSGGDPRKEAFLRAADQCLDVTRESLRLLDSQMCDVSTYEAYARGLRTFTAAAKYHDVAGLEGPITRQIAILEAAVRSGGTLGVQEREELARHFEHTVSGVERVRSGEPAGRAVEPGLPAKTQTAQSTIRVDQAKLDVLMRVVGELLVARGAFPTIAKSLSEEHGLEDMSKLLREAGGNISRIAEELQNVVMSVRMAPIRTVLQRFPRMVRDLARTLGKDVQLVLEGEETELDKTVAEQIADPLVHLVRNSLDHGLEDAAGRAQAGKPATGTIRIRTSQRAGSVTVEVCDDGRGLDPEALKRKAVERKLLSAAAAEGLSEREAFDLIFLPGLSTAAQVSDVSGRGVGMDVVRSNVAKLRGTIALYSERGKGTTVTITLPSSLMVSRAILLTAAEQEYILLIDNIVNMVKVPVANVREYRGRMLAEVRGEVFPLAPLAALLGIGGVEAVDAEYSVAIVASGGRKFGLVVSRFVSEVEVMVKPLSGDLASVPEFAGASVMGDGRLVLVLNPGALADSVARGAGVDRRTPALADGR